MSITHESNSYFIKRNYNINDKPKYYTDVVQNLVYQPEVYDLAYYLAKRSDVKYIIDIGGGNGEKLSKFMDEFKVIAIDYGENVNLLRSDSRFYDVIECNLEQGFPQFSNELLEESLIIFSDVVEHLVNPDLVLKALSILSYTCKFILVSTPDRVKARGVGDFGPPANPAHVREWSIEEFHALLQGYAFNSFMIGYTINTNVHLWKNTIIAVSGRYSAYKPSKIVRTLAIINVYNESDIILEVINHLLNQGIDIKVIDNWSNDGSYELVNELAQNDFRVKIDRFPEQHGEYYEWTRLLENIEEYSSQSDYDWFIHYDADELRESPWKNVSLNEAISFVDFLGFNAIDFTVIDFRPEKNEEKCDMNYGQGLHFFEFGKRPGHFIQIKAWKKIKGVKIELASSGGHEAKFVNRKIYPLKFITKHYPLRNVDQAKKKIFNDRLTRISSEEKAKGWHTQYNQYKEDDSFLWDVSLLTPWNRNVFDLEFFVERISGIGVNRKK